MRPYLSAALALFVLMAGACSRPGAVDPAAEQVRQTVDRLERVLDERARALATGDVEAFLRPLEPEARQAEMVLARGFSMAGAEAPSFSIPGSVEGSSTPLELTVRFHYRYTGLPDDNPFSFPITYRVVDAEGSIRITQSTPGPEQLPIWALGEVERASSEHFLALARPETAGVASLLETAESARAALQPHLPVPLDGKSLIVAARDDVEFSRLVTSSESAAEGRVAQVGTLVQVTPERVLVEGRHVVINTKQLAEDRTGPQTLRHELSHLALAPLTRPITPGWVAEGAAMYLAETRPTDAWARGAREGRFAAIRISDLNRQAHLGLHDPSGRSASAEYLYAAAIATFLVERFGADRYWDFYRSFAERPAGELYDAFGGDGSGNQLEQLRGEVATELLESSYGMTPPELDSAVRDWLVQPVA